MRIRTTMLALGLSLGALAAAPAFAAGAQTAHKAMTPQQQKMATCSHESKGMKGATHKKFMSDCLHGKTMAASEKHATAATHEKHAKTSQQEKMKTCNADAKAKSLKGAARKSFMRTCLKG